MSDTDALAAIHHRIGEVADHQAGKHDRRHSTACPRCMTRGAIDDREAEREYNEQHGEVSR